MNHKIEKVFNLVTEKIIKMDPMIICTAPRFLPLPLPVENDKTYVSTILWRSLDDGRIYIDCKKCNGKICGRGSERKEPLSKL